MNIHNIEAKNLNTYNCNRFFSSELAAKLQDVNAAVILQQLHYWLQKDVGEVVGGVRYIYNSFENWVKTQFEWLSSWQFRKSMSLLRELGIIKVIRYKAKQWNQTNYYTIDYSRLDEFRMGESTKNEPISDPEISTEENAESTEKSDLCDSSSRSEDTSQLEMWNTANHTKKIHPQKTSKEKPTPKDQKISRGGDNSVSNLKTTPEKKSDRASQPPIELSSVLKRPEKPKLVKDVLEKEVSSADVEPKINKSDVVQQDVRQESSTVEPISRPILKTQKKTPKGTKPRKREDCALWSSPEQRERFRSDLTAAIAGGAGNARTVGALVSHVMNCVRQGHSHTYWEEWIVGKQIGISEKCEWEAAPSKPYPKFVEYLVEKLIYGSESREQALNRVGKILNDKTQAQLHWRTFKRIVEGLRQDAEVAYAEGRQVSVPAWFVERADISLERAGESARRLAKLAPEQNDWIEKGLPDTERLLSAGAANHLSLSPQEEEESESLVVDDPWLDSEALALDFCFNGYIDFDYLEKKARVIAKFPGRLSFFLTDFHAAIRQASQAQKAKIIAMIREISPDLLQHL